MNLNFTSTRYILIVAMIFFYTALISQETLGGLNLGKVNPQKEVTTYIDGIKGLVTTFDLNDGRTFQIGFMPTQDGFSISKLSKKAYDDLVDELKRKYKIEFSMVDVKNNGKAYLLEAYKGNVMYLVDVVYAPDESFPYSTMVSIVDLELEKIAVEEGK